MASRWITTTARPMTCATGAALLVLAVCIASTTSAHTTRSASGTARLFSIHATPGMRTVAMGGVVRFRLMIERNRPPRPADEDGGRQAEKVEQPDVARLSGVLVRLSVERLPRGITARFSPNPVRGSGSILALTAGSRVRLGTDTIVVRGRGSGESVAVSLRLVVSDPSRRSFPISDSIRGTLAPGVSLPVDLRLSNPYPFALRVMSLSMRVRSISAPNASRGHPCTTHDFAASAFSGHYGFQLAPHRAVSLEGLGFSTRRWPHIGMTDRSVNQDGCKQAIVTLAYSGTAMAAGS